MWSNDSHSIRLFQVSAYRSTVVKGMGSSPFFLMHGREPVLPGQLVAETKMRVPERTVDFVEELGKRLKYAFQKVIRNDTMTKEERMNKSACLPDERYEVGDRLLHYRKPTDEEESMKITERWHHVMVDLAKHPYYEVRDAEGRVLSCNARFLMRDHTVAGAEGKAMSLRQQIWRSRLNLDVIVYDAALSAREQGPLWKQAMRIGKQLHFGGTSADGARGREAAAVHAVRFA